MIRPIGRFTEAMTRIKEIRESKKLNDKEVSLMDSLERYLKRKRREVAQIEMG